VTYTEIGVVAVLTAVVIDLLVLRTRVLASGLFWISYPIIVFFQLLTNGVLTGLLIVRYDPAAIVGVGDYRQGRPPFLGDGRLAFAPVEDLLFGFAMILLTLSVWLCLGRMGIQRLPLSGPAPRWWPRGGLLGTPVGRRVDLSSGGPGDREASHRSGTEPPAGPDRP